MPENAQKPVSNALRRVWEQCVGFITGSYIDRDGCDAGFDRMHRQDGIGDRVMLVMGMGGLLCLFGPVTMTEIALIPMIVFFFVRVINTYPIWIHGFGQPAVLASLLLIAWMLVALLWSEDRSNGLEELGKLRWLAFMGFLFPIIEQRTRLIGAMCVGLVLGQLGQVFDAFDGFGIEPIAKLVENHPGRIAGWWHPVVGGGMLVAAMGLHMPAAFIGSGRTRLIGIAGLLVSAVGVLATGTRGAWIAAVLLCVVGAFLMMRVRRVALKRIVILGVLGVMLLSLTGYVMRDSIMIRIDETRTELREIETGDFSSYSGRRVRMAQEAIEAFVAHPFGGVGTGAYERWCELQGQAFGAHAHNSTLHTLATLGIVGAMLWGFVLVVVLINAWRWGTRKGVNPYEMGPMLAILGLIFASLTDCVHVNAQSIALLGVLMGLCPAYAPGTDKPPAGE